MILAVKNFLDNHHMSVDGVLGQWYRFIRGRILVQSFKFNDKTSLFGSHTKYVKIKFCSRNHLNINDRPILQQYFWVCFFGWFCENFGLEKIGHSSTVFQLSELYDWRSFNAVFWDIFWAIFWAIFCAIFWAIFSVIS